MLFSYTQISIARLRNLVGLRAKWYVAATMDDESKKLTEFSKLVCVIIPMLAKLESI